MEVLSFKLCRVDLEVKVGVGVESLQDMSEAGRSVEATEAER